MPLRRSLPLLALLCVSTASAQSTAGAANISGVVRDLSGAVVPNAAVLVSNASNGITRKLNTNDAGVFTAGSLVPAPGYSVTVNAGGFASWELKEADLAVG